MGKLLKILIGLLVLLVVVVIVVPMVVDPNDYREKIQTVVKDKTGRDLIISGDLDVSVFPWIGLAVNEVSLSNAKNFKAEYFAQLEQANIKVKVLPLLIGQVEVSTVVLKGLYLNLAKNKAGKTNWEDMVEAKSEQITDSKEPTSDAGAAAIGAVAIGGLQVENANLAWDDESKNEHYRITNIDVDTDALVLNHPMALSLAFTAQSSEPKVTARLKLSGNLTVNETLNNFDFQQLSLVLDSAGEAIPGGAMKIDVATHLIADLSETGQLSLKPLTIKFDDSTVDGQASVVNFAKPAIGFNLVVDQLNADRYLPQTPVEQEGKTAQQSAKMAPPAAVAMIPVKTLRELDIDGALLIHALVINGLTADEASVKIKAKNGLLNTEQGVKRFYNGIYAGKTEVDARKSTPLIKLNEQVTGVNIEPLLKDLVGEAALSGVANLTADLSTRGNTVPAFKSALNGDIKFSFKEGAVTGVDIAALIEQGQSLLKGEPKVSTEGEGKTAFSDMSGTAKVVNGLVKNNDLVVSSPVINISGKGTANLVNEAVDYRLVVQRTKALSTSTTEGTKKLKNVEIPVNVGGTFSKPTVQLDVKSILMQTQKAKVDKKKQELEEKLNKKIDEKLKGGAGELLKGKAGGLLKGLF